ncbi:MAG: Gfo/Idh/MocA family oxidoreductase [Burkholderiales bacterium]|nr:Gfo/Idh/MocA family oxidoreductase [Opitutaceae bacterium]
MQPSVLPNRRRFLQSAALAALAAGLAPQAFAAKLATPAPYRNLVTGGRKLRVACIGLGGKGYSDSMACAGEDIVALCDVDFERGRRLFQQFPRAARYRDYRQMLAEMGDRIDAVTISTPDHTHFGAALMAIELGKHVYVQKPLTHTIAEARILKAAAAKAGVVTQMGNQGHANEGTRLTKEWIDAGVIGAVREVHIWTDRPIWPQGVPLPQVGTAGANIDWNLWLGVAPERSYSADLAPFKWRGFWDYGCGALGDMGCHIMDAAFWALDLRGDAKISAISEGNSEVCAPAWSIVTYEFPKRGNRPPVKLVWYDGKKKPPVLAELGPEGKLSAGGSYFIGDKGVIYNTDTYNGSPRLVPEERMKTFTDRPKKTIPRVPRSNPHIEWINACKGEGPAPGSNIVDYSADLTEMVLLGNLAIRAGQSIEWNSAKMTCANLPSADRFVNKSYRLF